jgi:hypothetical protein
MQREYGWPARALPANHFIGQTQDVAALEFSDFLVVCAEDLPEDVAHLLAWILCNSRGMLEQRYKHIPSERSPVSYPLVPENIANTPIPLHNGAARFYREADIRVDIAPSATQAAS